MHEHHQKRPDIIALQSKLDEVSRKRNSIERRIAALRAETDRLRVLEIEIGNEIHRAKQAVSNVLEGTGGPLNARSLATIRCWAAVHRALSTQQTKEGLSNAAIQKVILGACPGSPEATVRSYLHRFKKRGLIRRQGAYWRLTEDGHGGTPSEPGER